MSGDKEMGEMELRKHAKCTVCGQGIAHTGLPLFWRLTIERFGVDLAAAKRQDGLAALLGGSAVLAQIMGPDEPMAKAVMDPVTVTLCEPCAEKPQLVCALAEIATEAAVATKDRAPDRGYRDPQDGA
jgi:hypothetical protein